MKEEQIVQKLLERRDDESGDIFYRRVCGVAERMRRRLLDEADVDPRAVSVSIYWRGEVLKARSAEILCRVTTVGRPPDAKRDGRRAPLVYGRSPQARAARAAYMANANEQAKEGAKP